MLEYVFQVSYHVVFFDKQVSRAWVNAACIRNFSSDDDPEDMGKVGMHCLICSLLDFRISPSLSFVCLFSCLFACIEL